MLLEQAHVFISGNEVLVICSFSTLIISRNRTGVCVALRGVAKKEGGWFGAFRAILRDYDAATGFVKSGGKTYFEFAI